MLCKTGTKVISCNYKNSCSFNESIKIHLLYITSHSTSRVAVYIICFNIDENLLHISVINYNEIFYNYNKIITKQ